MKEEIDVLWRKRKCWTVVKIPAGVNLLRCHFVYKIKFKNGKVDRLKSRLVVDGSQQHKGIDYSDTFAPVVKYTTFRLFVAICAIFKMQIHQLDVKNAFIYAPLEEEVYVVPHPEMKIALGYCLKLLRFLYGLRQAPRNWNAHLHDFIISIGFQRSPLDFCLYHQKRQGHVVFLAVFVDDILIACANNKILCQVKQEFHSRFEMTDLGLAQEFLGIRINQTDAGISLNQSNYIDQLFDKYYSCLLPCRNYSDLPMKRGHIHREEAPATERQRAIVDAFPYSEITGAVLYLSVVTRFDISFAVGVLTRHMKTPTYEACLAASRLLVYLKKSKNKGLFYSGSSLNLHVYSDSDWASDLDTRRSTSGYVVMMAGGPISWMSKLQSIVATSSMEAEYISAYLSVQEVTWVRAVLHYLELTRDKPTTLLIDNKSAIDLAHNPVHHQRSKHIDIKYHWLRDKVADGTIAMLHVPTTDQRADIMTKVVDSAVFHKHVDSLMSDVP